MRYSFLTLKSKNRTTYFRRLIWLVLIAICIPVILVGSIYYKVSISHLTEELKKQYMSSLQLVSERTEDLLTTIEYESMQFSNSKMVEETFLKESFNKDYIYHKNLLDSMSMRKNMQNIEEMIYYNALSGLVLSSDYGYVLKKNYLYQSDIDTAFSIPKQAGWVYLPDFSSRGYISFVRLLPVLGLSDHQGAVIINVSEEKISKDLRNNFGTNENVNYQVIDPDGHQLFSSVKGVHGLDLTSTPLYKDISNYERNYGFIYGDDEQGNSTIHLFRKTITNRIYVASLTEEVIAEGLDWIKFLIFYTILIFLVVALLMSYICTKFAYSPVDRLMRQGQKLGVKRNMSNGKTNEFDYITECMNYMNKQSELLKSHLKSIEPNLREQFLEKVVKGKVFHTRTIGEESKNLHIEENNLYTVVVVTPEKLYKVKHFVPEEWPVISFSVHNIMKEILQKSKINGYVLSGDEMETIALMSANPDGTTEEEWVKQINDYLEEASAVIRKSLAFNVSIGVGKTYPTLGKAPESYREALLALQYRMYRNTESINIYKNDDNSKKQTMFFYPRELEAEIIKNLGKGDKELVEQYINEFTNVVKASESYNLIYQSYHVLLSSIIRSIEQQGFGLLDIMENNWFDQLQSRQTTDEILDWFIEVLFPLYFNIMEENKNISGGRSAVQKVWHHVKENIGMNLSLTECAILVGMSPSYLSRLFRRETGISFVDFVIECKVEEAKKLLRDTEYNVGDIAQMVGYSERNLSRVFKKVLGMSPGQFRVDQR